jgi:hypothetical protein
VADVEAIDAVAGFVHAIGNHLQLLRFKCEALRRDWPESREIELLSETVDRMIALTQQFLGSDDLSNRRLEEVVSVLFDLRNKKIQ